MRIRTSPIVLLLTLVALSGFFSCGQDRWPEYLPYTSRDLWIDSVMRVEYLWYDELPSFAEINYFSTPSTFLKNVVADDDDFSSADTLDNTPVTGYGFDYSLSTAMDNDTAKYAMVTYVMPNSPAEESGLERGEWIMMIGGEYITSDNDTLLDGGDSTEILVGEYVAYTEMDEDSTTTTTYGVEYRRTLTLPAAREVEDASVPLYTIVNDNIGYLLCNAFDSDAEQDLRDFSDLCAENGISDVVVDLRYNEGGDLSTAQLLATMLAPASAMGETMAELTYNDLRTDKDTILTFNSSLLSDGGSNLNLSTVYFLTTADTSAAAEALMNSLRPFMDVVIVGRTTDGFYVATEDFTTELYGWVIHLAVCFVYNADGDLVPSSGLTYTKYVSHLNNPLTVRPLGDPEEAMLSAAIDLIESSSASLRQPDNEQAEPLVHRTTRHLHSGMHTGRH